VGLPETFDRKLAVVVRSDESQVLQRDPRVRRPGVQLAGPVTIVRPASGCDADVSGTMVNSCPCRLLARHGAVLSGAAYYAGLARSECLPPRYPEGPPPRARGWPPIPVSRGHRYMVPLPNDGRPSQSARLPRLGAAPEPNAYSRSGRG
jgi:hypothetical protein